ncbi:MAG: molybdenum cofactor guanylyltransferase [Chlorobi bacterium]|nr:molybdenum cofactor guanylyltransferase [Chlorobiota bacterium]
MIDKADITGIILSGGKSTRMGSDKGQKNFMGKPLVEYAIEALRPNCGNLVLSANRPLDYQKYNIQIIEDEIIGVGPMGGVLSCLKHAKNEINIFLSCDTPYIDSSFIGFLIKNIDKNFDALVPVHPNNKAEPLCAYYNSSLINVLCAFIDKGDYKLMNFLGSIKMKKLDLSDWEYYNPGTFSNLNSPGDLRNNNDLFQGLKG